MLHQILANCKLFLFAKSQFSYCQILDMVIIEGVDIKLTLLNNKAIGKRLRHEREKLKLSREEFAELIGLSDYYVGQLERGERQMSLPTLVNIAVCLHVSLDYLVFGKQNCNTSYISDPSGSYKTHHEKLYEINSLLKKCSDKEIDLFLNLIKIIIPHIHYPSYTYINEK